MPYHGYDPGSYGRRWRDEEERGRRDWERGPDWEGRRYRGEGYYGGYYGYPEQESRSHEWRRREDEQRGFFDRAGDEVRAWFGDEDAMRRRRQDSRFDWDRGWAGPHVGRGPRGYQRSDERIQDEICERMAGHGYLDASDIEVRVQNREVTLKGTVPSRGEKRLAEEMAETVLGVLEVHNRLRLKQPAAPSQEESWQSGRPGWRGQAA